MPHPRRPLRRLPVAALGLLALGGCVSFGPKTPATLMTLSAAQTVAAGPARSVGNGGAVTVTIPNAVQAIATQRVAVRAGPTALAYLKNAQWADVPARLFRDLLAETIEARTGRVVPDLRLPQLAPDLRLAGRLEAFGVDASAGEGSAVAVVTFDAVLSREGRDAVQTRRFEARVPVAAVDGESVPAPLNQAANQVAADVADWIGR